MTTEIRKERQPPLLLVILAASIFLFVVWSTASRKVPMVGQSDPQIIRLKQYAATNHLHWKVGISEEGWFYCASLKTEEPYRFVVGCQPRLTSAVNEAINKWDSNYGSKVIGEGD